ncbi:hypothetical protein PG999_010332 [Apiospora kogelbergensis]|uniref:Lysine-specific metallo-endopeptidase domain-containing protein n=1 Tax=Apiospora kogelbergensis TaxID=1337665 RepID=A0AAW0QR66_9PEZI
MSRVGQLMVQAQDSKGDYEELPPTSARFRLVEALVHLGLSVLETPQGRQSLVAVGVAVVEGINDKRKRNRRVAGHIYRGNLSDMPIWVDRFLTAVRNDFPCIYINPGCAGEAQAERYNWGEDMSAYTAGTAAVISVSKVIVDNMLFARQQDPRVAGDTYDTFKFQMGISIAHEIVHLFVGFLTGTTRAMTPPNANMPGFGGPQQAEGEAGRYWEKIFLGELSKTGP